MDFDGNGYRMHYGLFGDPAGEPLLWLHGWSGTGEDWKYIFKDPPTGFRLIGPDARGNGASTGFEGTHSFKQSARDTFVLLDHLGVRRVKTIGLSGGGITLLHMATQQPERIDAMIAISAPPYFPERARAIQRQFSFASLTEAEQTAMRERSKGGEKQIEWLTEQTRAMAATTDDVQFTPAFPRYDHSENLDRLFRRRSLVSAPARSRVASIQYPVQRSGWCQTLAMARYLELTLLALLKPPPGSCTAIDLALRLQIKN